jgi:hypothetical protein
VSRSGAIAACAAGLAIAAAAPAEDAPTGDAPACAGPAYDDARRFVGAWQEFAALPEGDRLEGRLDTTLEAGGCAIAQSFTSTDGAFSFRSLGYVDPASGEWLETYVLSNNRPSVYRWQPDGEDLLVVRTAGGDPGTRRRLRVRFLDADTYRVVIETAPAGADEWTPGLVTMTRRIADTR